MADQASGILSFWLRKKRIQAALPWISGKVLDFGCGTGFLASQIVSSSYTGVDTDLESLDKARTEHPDASFFHINEMTSIENQSFDTIVMLAVVEHIEEPAKVLRQLRQLLRPAGKIVMTTPHPQLEWVHDVGAKFGLFSREASEDHCSIMGRIQIEHHAVEAGLRMCRYQRFLFGANQLAVLRP